MQTIGELVAQLRRHRLEVMSVREIEHAFQIRLECGVIINVYRTGKVLVQGKLDQRGMTERVYVLQKLLPAGTTFPPSMVPKIMAKPLVRDFDGSYVDAESHWYEEDNGLTIEMEAPKPKTALARLPMPSAKPKAVGLRGRNLLDL